MHAREHAMEGTGLHSRGGDMSNMANTDRILYGAGGAMLALTAMRRGGLFGLLGTLAGSALIMRGVTGHWPMATKIGQTRTEQELCRRFGWHDAIASRATVHIDRPREALYSLWREFKQMSQLMPNIERVDVLDGGRTHWAMNLPIGRTVEWTSRITEDRPNERIAWQSEPDAEIANAGWVEFREGPQGRGTDVTVLMAYEPPAGELGRILAKLWPTGRTPLLKENLQQFKQRIERGEVALPAPRPGAQPPGTGAQPGQPGSPSIRH